MKGNDYPAKNQKANVIVRILGCTCTDRKLIAYIATQPTCFAHPDLCVCQLCFIINLAISN